MHISKSMNAIVSKGLQSYPIPLPAALSVVEVLPAPGEFTARATVLIDTQSIRAGISSTAEERELKLAAGLPATPLHGLLRAARYAEDARRSAWDFALELDTVRAQGLSDCDLRWLCCKGLIEHAVETSQPGDARRTFCKTSAIRFLLRSSFVLTPRGVRLLQMVLPQLEKDFHALNLEPAVVAKTGQTPCWDQKRRELRLGCLVIKQFLVPAGNQELVLSAFQEEHWPERIDDPLPPVPAIDPKRRLHSTIQCLNRNQKTHLLQFHGDGRGRGLSWELLAMAADLPSVNDKTHQRQC